MQGVDFLSIGFIVLRRLCLCAGVANRCKVSEEENNNFNNDVIKSFINESLIVGRQELTTLHLGLVRILQVSLQYGDVLL